MPRIQIMEIWNSARGHAAVFRYKSTMSRGYAGIEWKASWELQLERRVVAAWRSVAEGGVNDDLQIRNELLRSPPIRSHGEAVVILELEIKVACPVSIQQIRREHLEVLH